MRRFEGSGGWLVFWILFCIPIAVIYYFMNYEKVEREEDE